MKMLIASAVSLLLGLVIGWSIGHLHAEHEMTDAVKLMVQVDESSDAEHAGRAARTVQLIESGDQARV